MFNLKISKIINDVKNKPTKSLLFIFFVLEIFIFNVHALLNTKIETLMYFSNLFFLLVMLYFLSTKSLRNRLKERKYSKLDFYAIVSWFFFALILFVSEWYHNTFLESFMIAFIVPIFSFVIIPEFKVKIENIELVLFISSLPFILVTIVLTLLGNNFTSNTIAVINLLGMISFLLIISRRVKKKNSVLNYFVIFVFFFAFLLILIVIKARTSILAFLVGSGLILLRVLIQANFFSKLNLKKIVFVVFGSVIFIFVLQYFGVFSSLLSKSTGDITSHRMTIWGLTLKNSHLIGEGYYFFAKRGMLGPHNLFFGLLGYTGIIGTFLFILWLLITLKLLVKNLTFDNDAFILVIMILFISCFEGIIIYPSYSSIAQLFYLLLAVSAHCSNSKTVVGKYYQSSPNNLDNKNKEKKKDLDYSNIILIIALIFLCLSLFVKN